MSYHVIYHPKVKEDVSSLPKNIIGLFPKKGTVEDQYKDLSSLEKRPNIDFNCSSNYRKVNKQRLKKAVEGRLLTDPLHFGDPLRKSLAGYRKLRVGDYRIIYKVSKDTITVLKIGHRKEVCKNILPID